MMEHTNNVAAVNTALSLSNTELTHRAVQILNCLALGDTDKQIANHLQISVKTVNHHVNHILVKLKATNRTHAVVKANHDGKSWVGSNNDGIRLRNCTGVSITPWNERILYRRPIRISVGHKNVAQIPLTHAHFHCTLLRHKMVSRSGRRV